MKVKRINKPAIRIELTNKEAKTLERILNQCGTQFFEDFSADLPKGAEKFSDAFWGGLNKALMGDDE